jgi:hypothetical protein
VSHATSKPRFLAGFKVFFDRKFSRCRPHAIFTRLVSDSETQSGEIGSLRVRSESSDHFNSGFIDLDGSAKGGGTIRIRSGGFRPGGFERFEASRREPHVHELEVLGGVGVKFDGEGLRDRVLSLSVG